MNSSPTPFIVKITPYLYLGEKVFLTSLVIGLIFIAALTETSLLRVSLIGLGVVFFLYAYKPIDIERQDDEPGDFSQLLALTILPKVIWISSAVSIIGLLLLNLGSNGYKQMLMIGGLTIGISILLIMYFYISGVKHIKIVIPILLRAVPLLLIDLYILFK